MLSSSNPLPISYAPGVTPGNYPTKHPKGRLRFLARPSAQPVPKAGSLPPEALAAVALSHVAETWTKTGVAPHREATAARRCRLARRTPLGERPGRATPHTAQSAYSGSGRSNQAEIGRAHV